jgi:hypothetical protein
MYTFVHGASSHFEVFEELVDLRSMQGQTKGSDFIQACQCSLQKPDLELPELVVVVTDGAPSVTD